MTAAYLRLGTGAGPPPPLAAQLAAWFAQRGEPLCVLDPHGEGERDWPGDGDLYVHLDAGQRHAPDLPNVTVFGPGADGRFVRARVRPGDPEPGDRVEDLGTLPIPTYAGLGVVPPAVRILAGRGDRVRPVSHVLREIVYLCEMHRVGHLMFDDADLDAFPGWRAAFEAELAHLPWAVSWEGFASGKRIRRTATLRP